TYSGLLFFIGSLFPLLEFSPVAVVGFDLPNMVQSQGDTEKMSPKNKQILDLVLKEVFNQDQATAAAGISVPTVPLNTLLAELKTHQPDQKVSYITVDNFNDKNAKISIYINVENRVNNTTEAFTYQGISGKLISSPNNKGFSATELKSTILNLHEGNFSPILLRWFYFFTGLMGAAMIATGSTLWVAKRRLKNEKSTSPSKGFKVVELLNISTIVGLLIAVAAYFWANRLLPIDLVERHEWEINVMFITWGLTFIYPMLRPLKRAWFELLYIAAVAYLLLPVINLLTTNRHLGNSIMQGDWVNVSFDVTIIFFGLVFVLAAKRAQQKQLAGSLITSVSSKPSANLKALAKVATS
ncbi:MAG: PepSY domain-containing protein, partial [Alteromonadales bacterium]|nr:PepSY domain-containing protein [Alteromonadales bacterium]